MDLYDRDGMPISVDEWVRLMGVVEDGVEYLRVAGTEVGPYWVSTVWLGLDYAFGRGQAPLIFETMVFATSERHDPEHLGLREFNCYRWHTEEEALAGHEEMVTLVRATLVEDFEPLDGNKFPG